MRSALPIDALELTAARKPAATATRPIGHRLGREPLAALVPPPLQKRTAGAGSHARAEPVCAGALALLGLVGALHVLASQGTRRPSVRLCISCRQRGPSPMRRFSRVLRGHAPGRAPRPISPLYTRRAEGGGGFFSPPGPSSEMRLRAGPRGGSRPPVPTQPDEIW